MNATLPSARCRSYAFLYVTNRPAFDAELARHSASSDADSRAIVDVMERLKNGSLSALAYVL